MPARKTRKTTPHVPVTVVMGKKRTQRQPDTFRVCPLGLQFYSSRKMQEFEVVDFNMQVPDKKGKAFEIRCTGVVVHCKPEKNKRHYRVWIKFLDLPQSEGTRLKCVSKASHLLCPHCENF